MSIFLSDSFFDKFTELPRNIQQGVKEFQKKFRENSTSGSIHLESITQFRDSSLRSARVTGEYRAIPARQRDTVISYADKMRLFTAGTERYFAGTRTRTCQMSPHYFEPTQRSNRFYTEDTQTDSEKLKGILSEVEMEKLLKIGVPEELIPLSRRLRIWMIWTEQKVSCLKMLTKIFFLSLMVTILTTSLLKWKQEKLKEGEDSLLSNNNKRRFIELTDDECLLKLWRKVWKSGNYSFIHRKANW